MSNAAASRSRNGSVSCSSVNSRTSSARNPAAPAGRGAPPPPGGARRAGGNPAQLHQRAFCQAGRPVQILERQLDLVDEDLLRYEIQGRSLLGQVEPPLDPGGEPAFAVIEDPLVRG